MQAYKPEWAWDVVLWNASGELTEGTIGNIALELDGIWYTPPVSLGLLPGIARQCAINDLTLRERVLYVHDIQRATRCVWMNSLRGWIDVSIEELSV
jgi:para-aminobenzoate synthetase/4-amino-4-deoxychorismate lyase